MQYNVTSHGTSDVTGDIEWTSSSFDTFNITVSLLDGSTVIVQTTVESSPLSNVVLNYNTNYTISVRGRNCGRNSTPATLWYIERE